MDRLYRLLWVSVFATSRAHSINRWTTGLGVRFFNVTIPIGPLAIGNSTGNFLMKGCRMGSCSQNSGKIETYCAECRPVFADRRDSERKPPAVDRRRAERACDARLWLAPRRCRHRKARDIRALELGKWRRIRHRRRRHQCPKAATGRPDKSLSCESSHLRPRGNCHFGLRFGFHPGSV